MAYVKPIEKSMKRKDLYHYKIGSNAERSDANPHNQRSDIRKFAAWSAGHFDKWGRV